MIKLSGLSILSLKGATITTRTASKWGGAMIKLSGLSICPLYLAY